ncbi:hypothetical protein LOC68_26830 [Blastopirellula sp. JC732]|uniref:Uncharacterized protein n=1 Tax=Blastopirellula sediminis TaxID=2894196 RepID=A0A9X1SMT4_9BACT|nr:hypothetical protein [Blastopirellula sediminis]MCC9632024.1 hypothetical protein [Blastopirellula sediminis]
MLVLATVSSGILDPSFLWATVSVVIGVPVLIRTALDLSRKLAAGWAIDPLVQIKSLFVSFAITIVSVVSAGIAGGSLCFAGVTSAMSTPVSLQWVGLALIWTAIPIGLLVLGIAFYAFGPKKVGPLQKQAAEHGGTETSTPDGETKRDQ